VRQTSLWARRGSRGGSRGSSSRGYEAKFGAAAKAARILEVCMLKASIKASCTSSLRPTKAARILEVLVYEALSY
jgi:hypothetical protein